MGRQEESLMFLEVLLEGFLDLEEGLGFFWLWFLFLIQGLTFNSESSCLCLLMCQKAHL